MASKVVDLTLTYTSGLAGFDISPAKTMDKEGWNASVLTFYSHSGTHMDAPIHFNASNETIDQIPVSQFIGKAWVIDVRHIGNKGLITYLDISAQLTDFQQGDSLILWTDWSNYINSDAYRNDLPRVSEELARWCVQNKVKMLAVEPPSIADVNNLEEVTRIHRILLGNVIIIEGLTNIGEISSRWVELIALPLKIAGGDGSPTRVIAIEKEA